MNDSDFDAQQMARALELARRGRGRVEPNPLVGCVIVREGQVVGEGWHDRFGGPHAEIEALRAAGPRAVGGTLYVTLEPCAHHGKTPPCVEAILAAGVERIVAAQLDPYPQVSGRGAALLRAAGRTVEIGLLEAEARRLNGPYLKLVTQRRPWIVAKWAMTLDGKIATRTGESRWISGEESRRAVHALRGRMDAIVIGRGTAERDDPLLTARPPGPRTPLRIVLDTEARLAPSSQLVRTASDTPLLIAVGGAAPPAAIARLEAAGCELFRASGDDHAARWRSLADELGRRRFTNVLVEGGGALLGSLFDAGQIDEAQVFIAPKLVGGAAAPGPLAGHGLASLAQAVRLDRPELMRLGDDILLFGPLLSHDSPSREASR